MCAYAGTHTHRTNPGHRLPHTHLVSHAASCLSSCAGYSCQEINAQSGQAAGVCDNYGNDLAVFGCDCTGCPCAGACPLPRSDTRHPLPSGTSLLHSRTSPLPLVLPSLLQLTAPLRPMGLRATKRPQKSMRPMCMLHILNE